MNKNDDEMNDKRMEKGKGNVCKANMTVVVK